MQGVCGGWGDSGNREGGLRAMNNAQKKRALFIVVVGEHPIAAASAGHVLLLPSVVDARS